MPSNSGRFMAMVHDLQTGKMPMHKASPRLRQVAMKMHPRDETAVKAEDKKSEEKPVEEKKEAVIEKSASLNLGLAFFFSKSADIHSSVDQVRKSVNQAGVARRKALEAENKLLKKHKENSEKQMAKLQADSAKQQASQQAAANQMPPEAVVAPAAQPLYGAALAAAQNPEMAAKPKAPPAPGKI